MLVCDLPATELGRHKGLDRHAIRLRDERVTSLHSTDTSLSEVVGHLHFDQACDSEASPSELDEHRSLIGQDPALDRQRPCRVVAAADGPRACRDGRDQVEARVMRKLVRTRRRSIRRQVVGCRADDPARARKAHRYERGILQVADMNSDVHAVIEEAARVDAQLELNAEMTLPLIDVVHSHSITRLSLPGPRASFLRTSSG